ncbi:hypothetical protein [Methylobacterium sp. WSM2598]|uniref:hypothetical protein n=1 Tax=Methylobacterium sp. WSM2598 TaxID=398261 RepID=UPI0012F65F2B|nr:hypothetical protein [Methylobacterium sp. WSM2598]
MAENEKPTNKKPEKTQAERFKETAREVGVDETGRIFEEAFSKIAPPRKRNSQKHVK